MGIHNVTAEVHPEGVVAVVVTDGAVGVIGAEEEVDMVAHPVEEEEEVVQSGSRPVPTRSQWTSVLSASDRQCNL